MCDQNTVFATEGMCSMNDRDWFECNQTQNPAPSRARERRETSLRAPGGRSAVHTGPRLAALVRA